ncbi:MAG: mechanosensitive ion channel family protein [Thermodesulfobacteriota bacterium]|nr:mechanosensitive ion channel family protein [Thermodesulfobacteriota bacterium]
MSDSIAVLLGLNPGPEIAKKALLAAIVLLGTWIFLLLVKRILGRRLIAWSKERTETLDAEALNAALSSLYWLCNALAVYVFVKLLPFAPEPRVFLGRVFLVLLTWLSIAFFYNLLRFHIDVYLRRKGTSLKEHRSRVFLPVVKGIAWIIALAFILENFGVKITTILAGLGVAGVAIGFAAQAVLGDLFSYFAILFDHPFRIGDFVVLSSDIRGHIEHIGLKTSRIRSIDGEQIIMSNSDLTGSRVKNYRRMVRRRILFNFGVVYQTPAEKLEAIPGYVKSIIDEAPLGTFDRTHFFRFGDSSLDFEVVYFVESPEYVDYMNTQQRIVLEMVRKFEAEEISFAYPTRTLHIHDSAPEESHA